MSDPTTEHDGALSPEQMQTALFAQLIMQQANLVFLDSLKGLVDALGELDSRELIRLLTKAMHYFKQKE